MVLKSTNIRNSGGAGPISIMSNNTNNYLGTNNMMRDLSRGLSEGFYNGSMTFDQRGGMLGGHPMMSSDSCHTSTTYSPVTHDDGQFSSRRDSNNDLHSTSNSISAPISPVDASFPLHPVYLNVASPTTFAPNYYYPGQGLGNQAMPPPLPYQFKQERSDTYPYAQNEMDSTRLIPMPSQQHPHDFKNEFNQSPSSFNNGNFAAALESTPDASTFPYLNQASHSNFSTPLVSPNNQSRFQQQPPLYQQKASLLGETQYQDSLQQLDAAGPLFNKSQATYANLEQGLHSSWSR